MSNFLSKVNKPFVFGSLLLSVISVPVLAFAEVTPISTSVVAALTTVQTDILGVISAVAPVAITVAGAFIAWKLGMRFFRSIAK